MSLLSPPFRTLVLDADGSPEQLVAKLESELDAAGGWGVLRAPGTRPWLGFVRPGGMEIRRRTPYRNSFLPVVRARFEPKGKGTRLHVSMSLMMVTRIVLGIWVFLASTAMVGLWTTGNLIMLAVPAMLVGVYLMTAFAFNLEANQAERYLRERLAIGVDRPAIEPTE